MRVVARTLPLLLVLPFVIGFAPAPPGQYWLDVCHDLGHDEVGYVDEVVYEHTRYEVTCSADPWAQGYGGRGTIAWFYLEVVVRDADGEEVVSFHQAPLRPTGAVITSERLWVDVDYEMTFVTLAEECTIDVLDVCSPELTVPVVVPEGASFDPSARQDVHVERDGFARTVSIDLCSLPGEPLCSPAADGGDDPAPDPAPIDPHRVWLHCADDEATTRFDNLNGSEPTSGTVIGWDDTAPIGELADSGCAYADPGRLDGEAGDLHLVGTYTGRLDVMTVEAYLACLDPYCRGLGELPIDLSLTIDGRTYVTPATRGGTLTVEPEVVDSTHARIEFTIPIGLTREEDDVEHAVDLVLSTYFQDSADAWLYDAVEVPAGITFDAGPPLE